MLEKAIKKINDEMEAGKGKVYVKVIGNFLLRYLDKHPDAAEKIMVKEKTIEKSLAAMRDEAKKNQSGGCAVMTDEEGFAVILKYFGISGSLPDPVDDPEDKKEEQQPAKPEYNFDIDLEDLL